MKSRYLENLPKRIIFVILGVVVSYFGIIPLGMAYHMFTSFSDTDPVMSYFFFNGVRIGIFVLFLYLALVRTKPSFIPQQEKYRKLALLGIFVIVVLFVAVPSGYVLPQLEQGACITKSGTFDDDGDFGGSSSQGIKTESECVDSCIFTGKFSPQEDKFCEFRGIFGKTQWMQTPDDFQYSLKLRS